MHACAAEPQRGVRHGVDLGQVARDAAPALAVVAARPDFARVVPKYTPGRACRSAHIAWRNTVNQACARGSPRSSRCQLRPASLVRYTAGLPRWRCVARRWSRPWAAPNVVGVARVQHDRKADVADFAASARRSAPSVARADRGDSCRSDSADTADRVAAGAGSRSADRARRAWREHPIGCPS